MLKQPRLNLSVLPILSSRIGQIGICLKKVLTKKVPKGLGMINVLFETVSISGQLNLKFKFVVGRRHCQTYKFVDALYRHIFFDLFSPQKLQSSAFLIMDRCLQNVTGI